MENYNFKNRISYLILVSIQGIASEEENKELKSWIDKDIKNKNFYDNLTKEEYINTSLQNFQEFNAIEDWGKIRSKLNRNRRKRLNLKLYSGIAASVSIAFIAILLLLQPKPQSQISKQQSQEKEVNAVTLISGNSVVDLSSQKKITNNEKEIASNDNSTIDYSSSKDLKEEEPIETTIIVPKKHSYRVKFEDGTFVILNANSVLKYKSKFSNHEREVTLTGEAFFDVAKESRPFIVKTGNAQIRVYGTKFNINTQQSNEILTTLISGSVGVSFNQSNEVMLSPNDMAILNTNNGKISVQEVDVQQSTSWLNNEFYYRKNKLSRLVNDLSAWYGVEFDYSKQVLEYQTITATFSRYLEIDDIVKSLNKILDIQIIKIKENKYEIR